MSIAVTKKLAFAIRVVEKFPDTLCTGVMMTAIYCIVMRIEGALEILLLYVLSLVLILLYYATYIMILDLQARTGNVTALQELEDYCLYGRKKPKSIHGQ